MIFKTLSDTEETLYYRGGIYHSGGEQIIKTELEKIAGYSIKINQRNEIIAHIKYRTIVNREEFDKNESVINVKNGLLDITTGEIRPHKHDYLSIIQSPVTYNPRATCPRVIKFLTGYYNEEMGFQLL